MRVLHCIYDDVRNPWVGGGGAHRAHELYRRLAGRVAATVVTGRYPGARDGVIDGVAYRRLGLPRPYALSRLSYGLAATRLLRREEYDAAVFDFSVYTPLLVPRDRPVGLVVSAVTRETAARRWGPWIGRVVAGVERRLLVRGRWFSPTSEWTLEQIRPLVGPGARFLVVGSGVPSSLFDVEREEADYLLFLGRLDIYAKGLDVLLRSLVELRERGRRPTLRVAGSGRDGARVRRRVAEHGLENQVELVGGVDPAEREALLAGAVALVMPSRFEGFGMVAAEAMAAGVPVVATAAGSLPELVEDGVSGVLVPSEDPGALAEALAALLDDPGARARLGARARGSAQRFRWPEVAERHLEFLERVAASAPAHANDEP